MNVLEQKMIKLLRSLRKNFSVVEVKTEFEAEGARLYEVMRLKDIASRAGLGLVLKIGGCEAITDMFYSQHIGVSGLLAPMIESAYAMNKFLTAIGTYFPPELRKGIHFGVNIETYISYKNLDDILSQPKIYLIDTLTLGRVDMCGSLGISRYEINSNRIYKIAQDVFTKAKKRNLRTTMGGGIAKEAIPFIQKLISKNLLDRFETRKVVFKNSLSRSKMEEAIIKANQFELMWLENKKNYYSSIYMEDNERIEMLKTRIKI